MILKPLFGAVVVNGDDGAHWVLYPSPIGEETELLAKIAYIRRNSRSYSLMINFWEREFLETEKARLLDEYPECFI